MTTVTAAGLTHSSRRLRRSLTQVLGSMKILRFLLHASLALVAFVAALVVGFWLYLPPMCGNDFIEAIPSPDGSKKVVVFQRDCGATTGLSTQASLLSRSEALSNNSGNIFTSDANHGAASSGRGGGPELRVVWRSPSTAAISYHPAVRIFKAESDVDGVKFSYSAVENAAQHGTPADRPASASLRQSGG